ncbi:site-specific integrase [Rhodococcus sp. T2V]|uniref:tyrosine-type recombinase/integrase n=1 Tax=Rhodococcus sp. T2V TaxID=3034164 RepID=UPI0023E34756|nr:site-specific integrase [Rhodococcus sp. T2V]MDF3308771.1 site-specific integrase [Rhodococcus sp. T2V]
MGHVQTRERGGKKRYVARYVGLDGNEHTKTFDKKGDAADWLNEKESRVRTGEWIDPKRAKITVREWCEEWYSGRTGIAPATLLQYRTVLDLDVLPAFGDMPLRALTPSQLRTWVAQLTGTRPWAPDLGPMASSTATTRRMIFGSILKSAFEEGLLPRSPMIGVRPPQRDVEIEPVDPDLLPTPGEIWALYEAAPAVLSEAIIVAAGSGLRQGELLGLRSRNARILRRELEVVEQVRTDGPGEPVYVPPKTPRARRRIPVGDEVCLAFARHLEQWPAESDQAVFRTKAGRRWRRTTFAAAWGGAKEKAGIRDSLRWHELRHFYASTLISGGASVREVMDRMGHASAEETIRRYSRLWPDREETTRTIVDAALRSGIPGRGTAQGVGSVE